MNQERDFKGVWIPKAVWLDERLNALDKIILTEVDSLDQGGRGCYASNRHLAAFCQCSETKVSTAISKLVKLGYLYVQKFDGRQRELKSRLSNFERQDFKNCESESQILKESNTENNPTNNTEKKERKKGKSSYDSIIDEYTAFDPLKEALYEFIKMRKLMKKPLTDRALKLLLKKLHDLSADETVQVKIVEQSIEGSWLSVYPLKTDRRNNRTADALEESYHMMADWSGTE